MSVRRGFAFLLVLAALGCGGKAHEATTAASSAGGSATLRPVTLALNWFPEAEHGGYYAALAEGFFAAEGLDVKIIPGGPRVKVIPNVARGEAQFGVAAADQILLQRAGGAHVAAILAPLQESPRCILVHEAAGITSLAELKNVKLAVGTGAAFVAYLKAKAPLENVQLVEYPGNVAQFLNDSHFAQQGYVFSEPYLAEAGGAKVRSLMMSELGYNPYASVLFASDKTLDQEAELVRKMARASRRGWQRYLEDPTAANAAIAAANPEMTPAALAYGTKALAPLCLPEGTKVEDLGQMSASRWETLAAQLREVHLLEEGKVDVAAAFRPEFLVEDP